MKEALLDVAKQLKISAVGICRARVFDELTERLEKNPARLAAGTPQERCNPFLLLSDAKSIIVCLFGYNAGGGDANLSRYARAEDYHAVAGKKLAALSQTLTSRGYKAMCFCDTGPLCDRYLAYQAGLGFFGRNHMLINPEWGSYTFIGCILTDAEIEPDAPLAGECMGCGRCVAVCPGGALLPDGSFDESRCASYLTQKKGELSAEERGIIKKSCSAWGCDLCQSVCPHNSSARICDIDEFKTGLIESLSQDMAASERDFRRRYASRAFSWRGRKVILRNLEILQEDK